MSKMNTKSRTIFETERKIPTSKPKKYSKTETNFNQSPSIPKNEFEEETEGSRSMLENKEIASENQVYTKTLNHCILII
jgi:hypothetical protein